MWDHCVRKFAPACLLLLCILPSTSATAGRQLGVFSGPRVFWSKLVRFVLSLCVQGKRAIPSSVSLTHCLVGTRTSARAHGKLSQRRWLRTDCFLRFFLRLPGDLTDVIERFGGPRRANSLRFAPEVAIFGHGNDDKGAIYSR